jgi:hypothetical protein
MGHERHPCSVGIGLGSHDLGVADVTVDLYRRGLFPPSCLHRRHQPHDRGTNAPRRSRALPRPSTGVGGARAREPRRAPRSEYTGVSIQDATLVLDMLGGAQQRLLIYPQRGFRISQDVPEGVLVAYGRLGNGGLRAVSCRSEKPEHCAKDRSIRRCAVTRALDAFRIGGYG